ncbi:hypothetical protein QRT07_21545 [Vibrio parahaemolyticus]|uniref:hypothetical protein n=1 Tax=Vibrio parahaemolyticus TaxID=670 RepID=UPI00256FC7EE|nr:hypothetical protein [Vibrio parahaemolyticus]WJE05744.1 hypothetical protein QRT07_21545 [Vibrio parahaemolyticus]
MKMTIEKYMRSYAVNVPFDMKKAFKNEFWNAEWIPHLKRWKVGPSKLERLTKWVEENNAEAERMFEAARILKEQLAHEKTLPINTSAVKSAKVGKTDIYSREFELEYWSGDEPYNYKSEESCVGGIVYLELEDGTKAEMKVEIPLSYKHYHSMIITPVYERGVVNHDLVNLKNEAKEAFDARVKNLLASCNRRRR